MNWYPDPSLLECTPHTIHVKHDLPLADVDCSDGLEE
jgi:hypothetical protein